MTKRDAKRRFVTAFAFRLAQNGINMRVQDYMRLVEESLQVSEARIVDDPDADLARKDDHASLA